MTLKYLQCSKWCEAYNAFTNYKTMSQ